jgi:hypothetical protein
MNNQAVKDLDEAERFCFPSSMMLRTASFRFPNGGTAQWRLRHLSMPSQGQSGLQADKATLVWQWWLGFTIVPARCQSERGGSRARACPEGLWLF